MQHPRLIIQVITRLIVGGAQLTVLGLCESLREHFEVRVVCGPDAGLEGSLLRELEATVPVTVLPQLHREISPLRDIAATRALRRTFLDKAPAIIHTHSSKAGILGRAAAPRRAAKVVHTVHGWGHTPRDPWLRRQLFIRLERLASMRTDALIAVSADVREEGCRLGIAHPDDYWVIPEYVDFAPRTDDFVAARLRARRALGLNQSEPILGWVGRFVPQKDPHTLIAALHAALVARSNLRAVLVGDGPQRADVEQRIGELGLSDRVSFTGLRNDARDLLPAFDVVIHVSLWEGQPRVVQEAIAEGVPVVTTRVSGVSDLVVDGRTGYLVEPGDFRSIAERALSILDSPSLRAPLPRSIVEEVASRHGREAVLEGHLRLYEQLLTRPL